MTGSKIRSKMNKYDRRLLVRRIIPYLFISCSIWTFSCFLFGLLVDSGIIFNIVSASTFYFIGVFSILILFLFATHFSINGNNSLAFAFYIGLSFAAGIVPTSLLSFLRFSGFLYIVFCVGIIPFTVIFLMTGILGKYYYSINTRVFHVILSFILTAGAVVLFFIFFELEDNIYYLLTSFLLSFYILILISTYSAKISGDYKANMWMLFLIRISTVFLLSLIFIGIIIGTIALIIIIINAICDSDFDFNFVIIGGRTKSKEKNKPSLLHRIFYYIPFVPLRNSEATSSRSNISSTQTTQKSDELNQFLNPKYHQSTNKPIEKEKIRICSYCGYENRYSGPCDYCGFTF